MTSPIVNSSGNCPNCSSGEIVEGRLLERTGVGGGAAFRPMGRGLFGWFFRRDAAIDNPVFACTECGLLWTFIKPGRVK